MNGLRVETLPVGEYQTNCYLVENSKTAELFIVDPGAESERIIQAIGGRKPVAVLSTHGHFDHTGAVDAICAHYGIPFYVHEEDIAKLTDVMTNGSHLFSLDSVTETVACPLTEGQKLSLAGLEITVMHTPGHSRGSCCFLLPQDLGVLCGDTLFDGGYGRTDIADGNFTELKTSLRRLIFGIPRQIAYPGHGGTTTAGRKAEVSL